MKNNKAKYTHSRRSFIKKIVGAGFVISFPAIKSCTVEHKNESILSRRQLNILKSALMFLWVDTDKIPTIDELNVVDYCLWVLQDKYVDQEENQYLISGLNWTDETAIENYEKHFEKLDKKEKVELLEEIIKSDWGKDWMSKLVSLMFEAMLADPIYGSNPNDLSWEWLNHNPGQPRPSRKNDYNALLKKKKENVVITELK